MLPNPSHHGGANISHTLDCHPRTCSEDPRDKPEDDIGSHLLEPELQRADRFLTSPSYRPAGDRGIAQRIDAGPELGAGWEFRRRPTRLPDTRVYAAVNGGLHHRI